MSPKRGMAFFVSDGRQSLYTAICELDKPSPFHLAGNQDSVLIPFALHLRP
ncbi:MAG: hypothetical protein IMW85_07980 [Thermicanus sp.]|nr:hypothetical protein [Thermicanus sp.]